MLNLLYQLSAFIRFLVLCLTSIFIKPDVNKTMKIKLGEKGLRRMWFLLE